MPEHDGFVQRQVTDVHSTRSLAQGKTLSANGHDDVGPCVLRLLTPRRPSAVLWLIVSIVVFSVDGMASAGAWTHVGQESRVIVVPSIADANPAPSVIRVRRVRGVIAARLYLRPDLILAWNGPAIELATYNGTVGPILRGAHFCAQTTAAFGSTCDEFNGSNDGRAPAFAATLPRSESLTTIGAASEHSQSTEAFASSVNESHLSIIRLKDTEGCIVVGRERVDTRVLQSRVAFDRLFAAIDGAMGDVWIEIENPRVGG